MTEAIIIESNRLNATSDEYRSSKTANGPADHQNSNEYNRWRSIYPSGLQIKTGDSIQVEACMLNSIGGGEEVIEFTSTNSNDRTSDINKLRDNKCRVEYIYYIHDRKEFNFPLPTQLHRINKNPKVVDYGGYRDNSFYANNIYNDCENVPFSGGFSSQQLTNKRLYILKDNYSGHFNSDNYETDKPSFLSSDIDYEVPVGFQFPSGIANSMTAQFHERLGSAEYKGSLFVQPSFFTMSVRRDQLIAAGSPTLAQFKETIISEPTDKVFCSIPTWTGQTCRLIADGKFSGEGVIYNTINETQPANDDQKRNYYSYMMSDDPTKYLGMANFHGVKSLPILKSTELNSENWKVSGIYSGDNDGELGFNICFFSDNIAFTTSIQIVRSKLSSNKDHAGATSTINRRGAYTAEIGANINLIDGKVGDVFPSNIFYNDKSIRFIAPAIRQMEKINADATAPFSLDFSDQRYLDSFEFVMNLGEMDDEESNPALGDFVFLPNPHVFQKQVDGTLYDNGTRYKNYKQYVSPPPLNNNTHPTVRTTGANAAGNILLPCLHLQTGAYEMNMKSQFNPNMDFDDFITKGGTADTFAYRTNNETVNNADYSLINPATGYHGDISLSRQYAVAIIPIFKIVAPTDPLYGVPFMGFILNEDIGGGVVGNKKIPCPIFGELFGPSRSLCDGNYSKVLTTQKVVKSADNFYPTLANPLPVPPPPDGNDDPRQFFNWLPDYSPYITVGASDPSITFDNSQSKFAFQGLSTSIYGGNGLFQDWSKALERKANTTADALVVTVNQRSSSFHKLFSNGDPVIRKLAPDEIKSDPEKVPYNYAQCGIAINKVFLFDFVDNPVPCNARQQKLFNGSMLDKMGFNLEQLVPFHGSANNEFNRGFHNSHLGLSALPINKQDNMVKPFTTNSYVNASIDIALVKSATGPNMYNLGSCLDQPSNTNATSDLCIAQNLPRKLDYPYLVVYSNLVDNSKYYGGQNSYDKLPAMAYVPRNYQTGDFIYSSASAWSYTADRDYILSELIVDIRLPNGSPAPLAANNSVIFKILRQNNVLQKQLQIRQEISDAIQSSQKKNKSNK